MAEESVIIQPTIEETTVKVEEQVGAGMWGDKPIVEEKKVVVEEKQVVEEKRDAVFDEAAYVKQHFGFDTIDAAKQHLADLKLKAETPAEIKFANEESKKFFELINNPDPTKKYELGRALNEEYELEQASKIEITDVKSAADILKLSYKYKYKNSDMTTSEINDMFNDSYVKPDKPELADTETEEDATYKAKVQRWEQQCESIDKRLIRDAKLAKPELSQFKSQIVFPDIPKPEATNKQPTQEELDTVKRVADGFLKDVDSEIKNLNEFNLTYKDEAVEIPVSYVLTAEEKTKISEQVKLFVESNYDMDVVLSKLWLEDGKFNISRMIEDLAYLNSRGKIAQKFVDDAVGKRMDEYTKQKKNIHLEGSGSNNNGSLDHSKAVEQVEAAIWDGKK